MYLLLAETFSLFVDIEKDSVEILRFNLLVYFYIQVKYLLHNYNNVITQVCLYSKLKAS